MSRFVVLHAADLHLDAPFEGVGRTPAPIATELRDASLAAWDALVDLAISRQVAAVLVAGGICAGLERGVRAHARFRDGLVRLSEHDIAVFVALGERDPLNGFVAVSEWPRGVTIFRPGDPTTVPLRYNDEALATVHGVSAPFASENADPSRFVRGDLPAPHFAVLHTRLAGHSGDDGTCSLSRVADLRAAGMDYWALGHAHALDYPATGAPWIVYPGTPQGRGVTAPECGPKGAVLIEVEAGAIVRVEFEPLDRVRCLRVELSDVTTGADLVELLTARAAALRERHAGRGLVLDGWIGGTAEATRPLRQPDTRDVLLRALRRGTEGWDPFVWWARLRAVPQRIGITGGDDLAAEVERRSAALAEDGGQCARFLARRFEPLRDAWSADVDPRDTNELLADAAAVAVAALREDEA